MSDHDQSQLGPYVFGVLEPSDVREVEEHLRGCADCRRVLAELEEMKELLGEVPPEAFLDGAPDDGDLLLQRTLRAARAAAEPAAWRRPRWMLAAASIAVIAAALGGGVLIGRQTVDQVASQSTVAGSKHVTATDATTGTTMATTVEPRAGWSWIEVRLTGLQAGAECELIVTDENGKTYVAGSWLVSEQAARESSRFSGGVLVPIDQVTSVEVKTVQGKRVVTTPI
jgi:putative zinc finger protein